MTRVQGAEWGEAIVSVWSCRPRTLQGQVGEALDRC